MKPFLAWNSFVGPKEWRQWYLQPAAGSYVFSSHGSPTQCIPRPSQLVSLFLASNEAINELYKSPKLSLELDG